MDGFMDDLQVLESAIREQIQVLEERVSDINSGSSDWVVNQCVLLDVLRYGRSVLQTQSLDCHLLAVLRSAANVRTSDK